MKKFLSWACDNWSDLLDPSTAESTEHEILQQNLQRSKFLAYILLIYEPVSLALMLSGYTRAISLWYIAPTVVMIVAVLLFLLFMEVISKRKAVTDKVNDFIMMAFFLTLSLALSALVIGEITQYRLDFLNYLLALALLAFVPIFRFWRLVPLLLIPFLAETIGMHQILHAGLLFEPIALFLFSAVAGSWLSERAVESIKNNMDLRRTAEQLQISEENYRMVLNQSGKDFLFLDIVGRTIHFPLSTAERFGIPEFLENVPESLLALSIFPEDSLPNILKITDRAISGLPAEKTLIKCHTNDKPDEQLWFSVFFSTVFDSQKMPVSALVICEDMTEQHEKEMAYKRLALLNRELISAGAVSIEYDLDKRVFEHVYHAALSEEQDAALNSPANAEKYLTETFLAQEEVDSFTKFADPSRLVLEYQRGVASDTVIYKLRQQDEQNRDFLKLAVQMIQDPYTGHIKAFVSVSRVSTEEQRALQMQRDIAGLKSELESSRIKAMINQMQPHFLYNALSAIQTIVKTDPERAYKLIYDFTVHLRASIKALSSDKPIPFSEELRNVKAYLNIEQMRFGEGLTVNYDIECDDFMIVPLSIQPLVENATSHGIWASGTGVGTVTIRSREETDFFIVEVEDDGIGFNVEQALKGSDNSYGLRNLIFRLEHLIGAEVIIKSTIGVGTLVRVQIPNNTFEGANGKHESSF